MNTILPQNNTVVRQSSRLFRNFLSGLFIACLAIRFLVKDWIDAFSIVYYSTPLPILAIFSFMLGMIWLLSKRIRFAKFYFIVTIGCLIAWSCSSFSANSSAPTPDNLKLFFWNAAYNKRADEIASYIHRFNADLIGIVEAGTQTKKARNIWKNAYPSYNVELLAGGMALITKGEILSKESGSLGRRGRFNLLEVALNGEQFCVLLVDVDGDPLRSRAPAFEPLAKMIRSHSQANLIVMGDFNTPLDSILFESFREYLTHAFESGGNGFAETWPIPLPILAIDHIWVSKKIKVTSCNLNWSRLSDHRSVAASLEPPLGNAK
ncbi:endonuclease/exonuclease/phosphatase family protein [candidate division KSB1 bacterium]|nr:endonuclease/exonuclease/phosphatase family protein [candidate division KSB1 bacterium]